MSKDYLYEIIDCSHISFGKIKDTIEKGCIEAVFPAWIQIGDQIMKLQAGEKESNRWKIVLVLNSA